MTIAQYLTLLRQHWILVVVLTVLGVAGAGIYTFTAPRVYQAQTQLFVSTSGQANTIGDLSQGGAFAQQRVKSYTDLLTSPRVLGPVITRLQLNTTATDLAERVSATNPLDTVLIDVAVEDSSPQRAADIANAISQAFPALVDDLETPSGQTASPVKVSVTRQAEAPTAPVSPRKSLDLALGLLVGLGLGVGAAVLRDSLDRSVGGRHQATDIVKAPVLGTVGEQAQAAFTPLIIHDSFSPRAEAFRQLRTNIRFLGVDHSVRSLVVTGSVQAEGKTTTAANLAIALAQSGEDVVLIDADLRRPTLGDLFGLPSGLGLTSVLLGDTSLPAALQQWREDLPLRVLTSGPLPPNPSELIGSERMAQIVHALTTRGTTVVLDSPPLLPVTDAAVLARITDGALLVVRSGSTKVDQLSAAAETLHVANAPLLGLVLNRVPRRGRNSAYYAGYRADSAPPSSDRVDGHRRGPETVTIPVAPSPAPSGSAALDPFAEVRSAGAGGPFDDPDGGQYTTDDSRSRHHPHPNGSVI